MGDVTRSPSDEEEPVRGYACEVLGCAPAGIVEVRRFGSGERHAVYRVSHTGSDGVGGDIVVRVSLGDRAEERARAEHEARVLQKVQGVAAPQLLDFRQSSRWFASPCFALGFVAGGQRDISGAEPGALESLGRVVGRLHRLPGADLVQPGSTALDTVGYRTARVERIGEDLRWVRDPLDPQVQGRLRRAMSTIDERDVAPDDGEALVLLHGDVAGGNVIWGAEPVLIDWEYARLGDPADEIAYLFGQAGLTDAQRQAFWRGYALPKDRHDRLLDRVRWWEPVALLGSALWWIERATRRADAESAGRLDPGAPRSFEHYLTQALQRLDRFERCRP